MAICKFKVDKFNVEISLSPELENEMVNFFKSQFKVDEIPDEDGEGDEGDCHIIKKGNNISIELQSLKF